PICEELCKAAIVVIILTKVKPKTALTGILIGFTVGAGFDMLENFHYAFTSYFDAFIEYLLGNPLYSSITDVVSESMYVMRVRVGWSFLVGHHYFTGIFAGLCVMFKDNKPYRFSDLFRPKTLAGLGIAMLLHALWNTSSVIEVPFLGLFLMVLDILLCFGGFVALVNIAIAQIRVMSIYEEKKTNENDAKEFAEAENETDIPTDEGVTVS
ncbi:MAG: PrsW family intramembrane metalloprotease, partial [Clostridia bacterium]|nr:PrsW family intramembrane metalloprotease [Clostridia bacterium]